MCCGTELAQMIQSVLIFREIGCTLTEARHQCNIDFKWNHQKRISETVIHFQVEACEIDGESSSTSEKLKEAKGVKYQGGGGKEEGKGERKKKNESTPLGEHPVSYINWYVLFLHIHRLVSTDTSLRPHHSDHAPTMPNHRHRQVTGESSPVNWI